MSSHSKYGGSLGNGNSPYIGLTWPSGPNGALSPTQFPWPCQLCAFRLRTQPSHHTASCPEHQSVPSFKYSQCKVPLILQLSSPPKNYSQCWSHQMLTYTSIALVSLLGHPQYFLNIMTLTSNYPRPISRSQESPPLILDMPVMSVWDTDKHIRNEHSCSIILYLLALKRECDTVNKVLY